MSHVSHLVGSLLLLASWATIYLIHSAGFFSALNFLKLDNSQRSSYTSLDSPVDGLWNPLNLAAGNNPDALINGTGVHGFIFNASDAPAGNTYYGGYNYCNMPHVNRRNYIQVLENHILTYVEVIHRHHKRTPYAANAFPQEQDTWDCSDSGLFAYSKPLNPDGNSSASTYWSIYTSPSNPFTPQGFNGTCQFPQITRGGLDDGWQHGKDLFEVYHDLLGFIPDEPGSQVVYRVTNNPITSQVAGAVIKAMYNPPFDFPLHVQPAGIDSLEPAYPCPASAALLTTYGPSSINLNWTAHLAASQSLFNILDTISGVPPSDTGFHVSWDHYFDNLSSRLCHSKPLPCNTSNPSSCITDEMANTVFRLGIYEYAYIYRSSPYSLRASTASFGVWIAELAQNIRDSISAVSPVKYRHNVAHDGSLAMLLSILQVDEMVWPGLGAEVVFEIYKEAAGGEGRFVRVLWGGVVLRSSFEKLGVMDMVPVEILLQYFEELVGVGASKVPEMCL